MVDYIAEIGKNFIDSTDKNQTGEDCLLKAKRLVFHAKESGATVVKFQAHVWQDEQDKRHGSRYWWTMKNEESTPKEFWWDLMNYCDSIGIELLITPMSKMAAQKVNEYVKRWKVSSADIVDFELLEYLRLTGKPIIISAGMSTEEQIEKAVAFLGDSLQLINYCVSLYPCPVSKIDLTRIIELFTYGKSVGFSDHSLSVEVPALAVRMGAVAIEKHFTLDRNAYGPDHKVSLLPNEFKKMVELCELAEKEDNNFEEEKLHWEKFRKVA